MSKFLAGIGIVLAALFVIAMAYFTLTPSGASAWNSYFGKVEKAGTNASYDTRKKVEDTARQMIASYKADKIKYEQYKTSDSKEKQNWGEEAKMRANQTATTYNEFILKNSYLWEDNVPADIFMNLAIIE